MIDVAKIYPDLRWSERIIYGLVPRYQESRYAGTDTCLNISSPIQKSARLTRM
jgi:hypothetical protein